MCVLLVSGSLSIHLYYCWSLQAVALLVFIVGAVFSGNVDVLRSNYSSAGGWLAFVSFVIMVIETILIVGRFINFAFVYQYSLVVMIVVSERGRRRPPSQAGVHVSMLSC